MADESNGPVDLCMIDDEETADEEITNHQEQGSQGENGESVSTCMICMEDWTIGSAHRICCLKCGHLFGRSCIERWIREKGQQAKCPNCNKPARRADLRDLWCKTIKAYDSTELAELRRQFETEREQIAKERSANFHLKNINTQLYSEIDKLKKDVSERDQRLRKLEKILGQFNKLRSEQLDDLDSIEPEMIVETYQQPQELKGKFFLSKDIESHPAGICKCMTVCPTSRQVLIAQPLPPNNPRMGNDFGIRKYSLIDTQVHSFMYLHSQPVTSMQVKPFGDLILTSGQDKKIHLTSINNNRRVQSYTCHNEPTFVSWSVHRDQQFYVASRNCFMTLYDMRNTSDYIYQKTEKIARTTVVSMTSVAQDNDILGVVANDIKGSQFIEVSEGSDYELEIIDHEFDHLKTHQLPFFGKMGTVDYHKPTKTTLITTKSSNLDPTARCSPTNKSTHSLVRLKRIEENDGSLKVGCEHIRTFYGQCPDLRSQTRILRHPTLDNQVLIGASDESARGIKFWDASDNTLFQAMRTGYFVRDMLLYTPENTNQHLLLTLHDKGFGIYRWDYA